MNKMILSFYSKLSNRADVIGAITGSFIATVFGANIADHIYWSPAAVGVMMSGIGNNWPLYLKVMNLIFGAAIGFTAIRIINAWLIQNRIVDPAKTKDIKHYALPEWIKPKSVFSVTLGESHGDKGYVSNPTWSRIPEKGLYGNILAVGGIGSGKTASVANPILRQILEFSPYFSKKKMGGLILDVKGSFASLVKNLAVEYSRDHDLVVVNPENDIHWNPINEPNTPPETLAGRLLAVYQNTTQDSGVGSQAWVSQGILKLLTHTIGILREYRGYITIHDCNNWIAEIASGDPAAIERASNKWDKREARVGSERYEHHHRYFTNEWTAESDRTRGVILSATKNVTGLFSVPEVRRTFSPKEEEINFPGFESIINSGQIVLLDMPSSDYGVLANAVGTLMKLSFQRSTLSRVARSKKDKNVNTSRSLFFICDEYQKFVSVSGSAGEGDEQFYALSRESKCFSLLLTQSPMSIISKIGPDAARVMFASLRTKLFLSMVDPHDAEMAAKTLGEDWLDTESVSFSESLQNAGFNPIDSSISGTDASVSESRHLQPTRRYVIEPIRISQLRTFECFASIFDGIKQLPPQKIYLKTDFIPKVLANEFDDPRTLPFNKLIEVFEKELES
jgi:hypothetical protein